MRVQDRIANPFPGHPSRSRFRKTIALIFQIGFWWFAVIALHAHAQSNSAIPFSESRIESLVALSAQQGDFERGLHLFTQAKLACFSCHRIGTAGGIIGPELTQVAKTRTPSQMAESLLWPNRAIEPEYQPMRVLKEDGTQVIGYLATVETDDRILALRDPATKITTRISRSEIESEIKGQSLMPDGLINSLSERDQADLLSFLVGLGRRTDLDRQALEAKVRSANIHEPATFSYERGPLHADLHPAANAFVNRDRVYDYYAKQAAYFGKLDSAPRLLAPFPGLDGANFGHWGNQNEESWKGNELNASVQGIVRSGVLVADRVYPRAVCFRFGPNQEWSACFNPDTFAYEKIWLDGFVQFSDVRHGLMDGMRIAGRELQVPAEARSVRDLVPELSKSDLRYQGYHVLPNQIVFTYTADGQEYWDALTVQAGTVKRVVGLRSEHPFKPTLDAIPKVAPHVLQTDIRLGSGRGFVIDSIELPLDNPWRTLLYCGDHDFLSDGSAIIATVQGDVWRVKNFAYDDTNHSPRASWIRIASGLYQALGVVVHDDEIYVLGRNQITRLHDRNGDGETDFYECFSNAFKTSGGGHDYICGLQRDSFGNFYCASGNQGVLQISPDGQLVQVVGTGFRNPDGLGLMPDGTLTVPASEGDWTPASMIFQIEPKRQSASGPVYETTPPPFFGHRGPKAWQKVELPLVYLPRGLDNSSGGQTWVEDARLGPLNQQLVHTSYGSGRAMLVLRDRVGEQWQGAVVPLPGEFRSGIHRARVHPKDGCLYVSGMNGWGSYTPDSGCFQRVRWTGDSTPMPIGFHVHNNGVAIRFSGQIDHATASYAKSHFAQCWNYRYSPGYGSKEFSVLHPPMIGHDRLDIASSHVLDSGTTLFLEIPELQRCSQLHLSVSVRAEESQELFATVNAMDADRSDFPGYRKRLEKTLLEHPMTRDLDWLKRSVPNPWSKRIGNSRELRIASKDNLQFSERVLETTVGERLKLVFSNPDVVPHNWALIRPGTLAKIGELTNGLVNDPEAFLRHYVPQSDDVVCYTDIVNSGEETTIYFTAPNQPGRYPYLCTFPGHWMVMNGELVVRPNP
jgi:putative heme-binding domain-containing protein